MKDNQLTTYKFFDKKGRRLSIFGIYDQEHNGINIYIITCSKADRFSKKEARSLISCYLNGDTSKCSDPDKVFIFCPERASKKMFIEYCNENFYKLSSTTFYGTNIGLKVDTLTRWGTEDREPEALIQFNSISKVKIISYLVEGENTGYDFNGVN